MENAPHPPHVISVMNDLHNSMNNIYEAWMDQDRDSFEKEITSAIRDLKSLLKTSKDDRIDSCGYTDQ